MNKIDCNAYVYSKNTYWHHECASYPNGIGRKEFDSDDDSDIGKAIAWDQDIRRAKYDDEFKINYLPALE